MSVTLAKVGVITILGVGLAALPAGILANGLANELRQRIETLRKEVGLSTEQMQDILLELIHERKKEQLEQEKNKYFFCPHCGHKLPD